MATITVKGARNLEPGDVFADGAIVTEVWDDTRDGLGVWLATDDGDAGYVLNENRTYRVDRYFPGE
jgi:hypothetical protein